jgi:chaperonin GroEL
MQFMNIHDTQTIVAQVVSDVRRAVVSTMGPNGKLALISVGTGKKVTKDGVTVAKSIKFEDPFHELVNKVITEPAVKTDVECGDGTTTTILLTSELYNLFRKYPGYRDQKFIERLVAQLIERLSLMAVKVEVDSSELYQLALTSSNGDEALSQVITGIFKDTAGKFPEIELKEGVTNTDKVVRSNGLPVQMQFSNPSFSENGNGNDTTFKRYYPLVIDDNIRNIEPAALVTLLRSVHDKFFISAGGGITIPVMLIARSIDNSINSVLGQINHQAKIQQKAGENRIEYIGVQTNFGGSVGTLLMQDIAVMLGVPMFKTFQDVLHGQVNPCTVPLTIGSSRSMAVIDDIMVQERINERVALIEKELSGYEAGDRFSPRARFNETRIRNLKGELVTVFVGGETQSEVKERIDRFEDVGKAVKSALLNGILPGVGTSLIYAGQYVFSNLYEEEFVDNPSFKAIVHDLENITFAQFFTLMDGIVPRSEATRIATRLVDINNPGDIEVLDLATGRWGTPGSLGIYDTAYASITALKGGMQTAKILANLDTILLGSKASAVSVQD